MLAPRLVHPAGPRRERPSNVTLHAGRHACSERVDLHRIVDVHPEALVHHAQLEAGLRLGADCVGTGREVRPQQDEEQDVGWLGRVFYGRLLRSI